MSGIVHKLHRCRRSLFEILFESPSKTSSRYLTTVKKKSENTPIPAYVKRDHEFKIGKKFTIETLEKLFGIRTFYATEIALKNRNLCKVNGVFLRDNYEVLKEHQVTNDTLLKYPVVLAGTDLQKKIEQLKRLPFDINSVIILLKLSLSELTFFISSEELVGFENGRIKTLSNLLQISIEETCKVLVSKTFIRRISLDKIKSKVEILNEFGVGGDEIATDLWVLQYKEEQIRNRLSGAKDCNIEKLKTWMVRAQPTILETYVKRRSETKSILGDNSLTEYLSERLGCAVETANYLITKQPALNNKSLKKLNELIDYLFSAGFMPHHIIRVPKILVHSVDTIKKRLKQLNEKGFQVDSLYMLTKSQKQFNQYYEALIKSKGKTKSRNTTL